jgi:hypothetical protein
MLRKPTHTSAGKPSFFYLLIAECCFQRSVSTHHPNAASTLREIGRNYLANASGVSSTLDSRPLALATGRLLG